MKSRYLRCLSAFARPAVDVHHRPMTQHRYHTVVEWTGNRGRGTASYTAYSRDFIATVAGKPALPGSADPAFRGDASRWNPEDMLLAATSVQCRATIERKSDASS